MRFDKFLPSPALLSYVKHYIFSEQDEEQEYKVLPGTALVMGFQYRGSLAKINAAGTDALATSGITGLNDTFSVFKNSKGIGTLLVFFTETGASHFFKVPLNELFSESLSLDTFVPASLIVLVEEQLAEALTDAQRIAIIERFLLSQLQHSDPDTLISEAVRLIMSANGTLRISELSQKLYISQSPLEKRFRKTVGATPKKFSSIIRLHSAINNYANDKSLTELGYASGYFDQAHFIKDFKQFTGETPEKFFTTK
jgi:AraC-like DNA-binding protein